MSAKKSTSSVVLNDHFPLLSNSNRCLGDTMTHRCGRNFFFNFLHYCFFSSFPTFYLSDFIIIITSTAIVTIVTITTTTTTTIITIIIITIMFSFRGDPIPQTRLFIFDKPSGDSGDTATMLNVVAVVVDLVVV